MRAYIAAKYWDESNSWTWTATLEDGALAPGVGNASSEDQALEDAKSWASNTVRERAKNGPQG